MPDLEAIGDAVTGGVVSRAIEPRAGEPADGHTNERECLNCGCALVGEFCHCCGQHAHVHRTVGAWWHDFLHSVLHLDGKVARTLPLLALHPGQLTRRYARGERARFISPLALFLFSVFLMFAAFSILGTPARFDDATTPAQDRAEAEREIAEERADALRELAELEQELRQRRAAGRSTAGLEAQIASTKRALEIQERAYQLAIRLANEEEQRDRAQARRDAAVEANANAAGAGAEEDEPELNITDMPTGWPPLDRAISKAEKNPSLLFYKIQANAYKFSWALIPISLPFLWLLFLHRRRYRREFGAYDHLVFVTYSIAFMSLGAIVLSLLRPLGISDAIIGIAIAFVPPIHIYRQLRGAYDLSRWSAVWRTAVLLISSFVALALFFVLLVVAGVLG